jgi:hypothetical protein
MAINKVEGYLRIYITAADLVPVCTVPTVRTCSLVISSAIAGFQLFSSLRYDSLSSSPPSQHRLRVYIWRVVKWTTPPVSRGWADRNDKKMGIRERYLR